MKKKGFTLIELLAVIVILAIIALIATPVVLNIIEDSKLSAAKDSAMVISKAAETYYMSQTTLEGEEVLELDLATDTLKYKGEKPEKGYVTFDSKGNSYLKMYKDGYCIVSDYDNTVSAEKMENKKCKLPTDAPPEPLKNGQIVYFNPITNSLCSEYTTSNSKNGFRGTTAKGCMLWHAFLDTTEAETVKLILDHNTSTDTMTWEAAKTEIANAKDNNLYGWHADVYGTVRLISALEVNEIAPYKSGLWVPSTSGNYYLHTGTSSIFRGTLGTNKYAWLFDNTDSCDSYGCSIEQYGNHDGYWTSTEKNTSNSWGVNYSGNLYSRAITNTSYNGVRPVIELPKSMFEEWQAPIYTVTFKDGDEVIGTKEVEYKALYGTLPTLEKEGYDLVWKVNGVEIGPTSMVSTMGDHVVETYWRPPTYLAKLYFNPITNSACGESDYDASTNSVTGFKGTVDNGCLLWFAYKEENGNYLMIADHNTSTKNKYWADANIEIADAKDDTTNLYGWHADVRSTIRMISVEELLEIAPYNGTWSNGPWYNFHTGQVGTVTMNQGTSKYAWLIDNLSGCIEHGCNSQNSSQDAYWTSTPDSDTSSTREDVWMVDYRGGIFLNETSEGIRPVISVPKSKFTN